MTYWITLRFSVNILFTRIHLKQPHSVLAAACGHLLPHLDTCHACGHFSAARGTLWALINTATCAYLLPHVGTGCCMHASAYCRMWALADACGHLLPHVGTCCRIWTLVAASRHLQTVWSVHSIHRSPTNRYLIKNYLLLNLQSIHEWLQLYTPSFADWLWSVNFCVTRDWKRD